MSLPGACDCTFGIFPRPDAYVIDLRKKVCRNTGPLKLRSLFFRVSCLAVIFFFYVRHTSQIDTPGPADQRVRNRTLGETQSHIVDGICQCT